MTWSDIACGFELVAMSGSSRRLVPVFGGSLDLDVRRLLLEVSLLDLVRFLVVIGVNDTSLWSVNSLKSSSESIRLLERSSFGMESTLRPRSRAFYTTDQGIVLVRHIKSIFQVRATCLPDSNCREI